MKLLVCTMHSDKHRFGDWLTVSDAEAEALLALTTAGRPFYELLKDLGSDSAADLAVVEEAKADTGVVDESPKAEATEDLVTLEPAEEKADDTVQETARPESRRKRATN